MKVSWAGETLAQRCVVSGAGVLRSGGSSDVLATGSTAVAANVDGVEWN